MNEQIRKILRWAIYGGVGAFVLDWIFSGSQPTGQRIALGVMCALAGFVTGGLLCANFAADDSH